MYIRTGCCCCCCFYYCFVLCIRTTARVSIRRRVGWLYYVRLYILTLSHRPWALQYEIVKCHVFWRFNDIPNRFIHRAFLCVCIYEVRSMIPMPKQHTTYGHLSLYLFCVHCVCVNKYWFTLSWIEFLKHSCFHYHS